MATKAELERLNNKLNEAVDKRNVAIAEARQLAEHNEKVVTRNAELRQEIADLTKNKVGDTFRCVSMEIMQGDNIITYSRVYLRKGDVMNLFVDADGEVRSNVVRHDG